MAEAVITRGGIGGGSADISNETKEYLGLNNNASLDDVIQTIAAKDPNMATLIVSVRNPDGSIPTDTAKIQMTPVSGSVLTYNTNESGACMFKTNAGQCNLSEVSDIPYIDLKCSSPINNFPAVIGSVYRINMVRKSSESVRVTTNKNIVFSGALKSADIYIQGGCGGGGTGWYGGYSGYLGAGVAFTTDRDDNYEYNHTGAGYNGGYGGGGYKNNIKGYIVEPLKNYEIIVGAGGAGGPTIKGKYYNWTWEKGSAKWGSIPSISTTGSSGSSGGTTRFSNLISAIGGSGGYYASSSENGSNGTGDGLGGIGGGHHHDLDWETATNTEKYHGRAVGIGEAGGAGQTGFVIINNFIFK